MRLSGQYFCCGLESSPVFLDCVLQATIGFPHVLNLGITGLNLGITGLNLGTTGLNLGITGLNLGTTGLAFG